MRCPRRTNGKLCNAEVTSFSIEKSVGEPETLDILLKPCNHCIDVDEPEFVHVFAMAMKELETVKEKTDA